MQPFIPTGAKEFGGVKTFSISFDTPSASILQVYLQSLWWCLYIFYSPGEFCRLRGWRTPDHQVHRKFFKSCTNQTDFFGKSGQCFSGYLDTAPDRRFSLHLTQYCFCCLFLNDL